MKPFVLFFMCLMVACPVRAAKKVTWVIDAGHGGHDVGCESRTANEKTITLAVAKELGQLIKKQIKGVRVVYTRERDTYLTLQERCDIANKRGAALFISIHANAAANPFARGTETFFATNVPMTGSQSGKSELLALLLQRQYLKHGREVSRGVKQRELYVCEHTNMPSVLTELGFISNLNEEAYLTSKAGQKELAQTICEALAEWKDMTKNGTVSKRDLQKLRYTHYAPISMVNAPEPAPAQPVATSKDTEKWPPEEPKQQPEQTAETKEQAGQQPVKETAAADDAAADTKTATSNAAATASTTAATATTDAATDARPYFCIQLMNTATKLKAGDYRLKGFKNVQYLPAGGRFKVLYGHSENYRDIKNLLAEVRETFPEAFIVAFVGERQISTAEALEWKKK